MYMRGAGFAAGGVGGPCKGKLPIRGKPLSLVFSP